MRATEKRGDGGKRGRQALGGRWEEVVGAKSQKVRGRGVLMAVCRAGLWGMLVGCGARGIGVCGWMDGWMERGIDGVMGGRREVGGERSVVSSWPPPRPLIRAAQACRK